MRGQEVEKEVEKQVSKKENKTPVKQSQEPVAKKDDKKLKLKPATK